MIQCYAPTNDAEESDKENFYFNTLNVILNQQKENNKFVIGGSIDAHKRIHKATWVSPDHKQGQRKAWHIPSPKIGPDDLENQKGSRFS